MEEEHGLGEGTGTENSQTRKSHPNQSDELGYVEKGITSLIHLRGSGFPHHTRNR
jgi:hypothetical protein